MAQTQIERLIEMENRLIGDADSAIKGAVMGGIDERKHRAERVCLLLDAAIKTVTLRQMLEKRANPSDGE